MISREELINNPDSWTSTENLDLDVFDVIFKKISASYYLKKKNSDVVYYGYYEPDSKYFECIALKDKNKEIIKREEIEFFISLPELNFTLQEKYIKE